MNKKSILKKCTGKGGPTLQRIGNTVRNVVRTVTKGNDPEPKETQSRKPTMPSPKQADTVIAPTKPLIPYSNKSANPGPTDFRQIVVPSQRIPGAANEPRILPNTNAKKVNPPEFRDKIPAHVTGAAIAHEPSSKDLPKIPSLERGPDKEVAKDVKKKFLRDKVKSIM